MKEHYSGENVMPVTYGLFELLEFKSGHVFWATRYSRDAAAVAMHACVYTILYTCNFARWKWDIMFPSCIYITLA